MKSDDRCTTLIICRDPLQLQGLPVVRREPTRRYVLATDDPLVWSQVAAPASGIDDVCWLERMESTFQVGKDVMAITEVVNEWAEQRAGHGRATRPVFTWLKSIEPGEPAGQIQEVLLLVRSYIHLIDTYCPDTVLLLTRSDRALEDRVLFAVAQARGIQVDRLTPPPAGLTSVLKASYAALRRLGRAPRSIVATAVHLVKLRSAERRTSNGSRPLAKDTQGLIAFQLASPLRSQIENVRETMTAVSRRGYRTFALTCFSMESAVQARRSGLDALDLASFLSAGVIIRSLFHAITTCSRIAFRKREFITRPNLQYCGVPLGELLWPLVLRKFSGEVIWRAALAETLTRFLAEYSPVAMKLWGGVNLREGYLAWRAAAQLRGKGPLLFNYEIGSVFPDWPYRPDTTPYLLFVPGQIQIRALGRTIPADQIVAVGSTRYRQVAEWAVTADSFDSRRVLSIPGGFDFHVCYDSNGISRGVLSAREQTVVATALLDFAKRRPNCALIIKPHPTHVTGFIDRLIAERGQANVFLAPHDALPYAAMNAADVVITKVSTLIVEGMLLKRPVISVALDNEPGWTAVYGSAIERLNSVDGVNTLLERLVSDPVWRSAWIERRRRAQDEFLKSYFDYSCDVASDVLARSLDDRIASRERADAPSVFPASA